MRLRLPTFFWPILVLCFSIASSSCGGGGGNGGSGGGTGGTGGGGTTQPSPDFTLTSDVTSATVPPGGAIYFDVSVTSKNNFSGSVNVTLTGVPAGATLLPGTSFTVAADSYQGVSLILPSGTQGNVTLSLEGTSNSLQHSTSVSIDIQQQTLSSFGLNFNGTTEMTLTQGGSLDSAVGIEIRSADNPYFDVQLSAAGLPSGVQVTFAVNPFLASEPMSFFTLTASSSAPPVNYVPITITATRLLDGAQESGTINVNVVPPNGTLPQVKADFVRMDGNPAAAVFDSVHNVIYASNPDWNRVEVISPSTHQILSSIPAPSPTGMDLSLDKKYLIVTSNVQRIVSIDTASLQVVKRYTVPTSTNQESSMPDLIANTSNGTALVGMTNFSSPPSYYLERWNPTTNTFTDLTAPGVSAWINQMVRTGDGAKVLVVDYGSDVNMAVYDASSNTFTASGESPVGGVVDVAGNPTSHQFAVAALTGFAFVDATLNTLATITINGGIWGMTYSPDGSKLYVSVTEMNGSASAPLILTYDTNTYQQIGVAPSETGVCITPFPRPSPDTADTSGLVYSIANHGLNVDDSTNYQNVLSLPVGPPCFGGGASGAAPLNQPYPTTLAQSAFDVLPDIWFGNARGTNAELNFPTVSVTAPPSATPGLVNMTLVFPDGWFAFAPQAFSYGSQILFTGASAGPEQGGGSLALIGYGLIGGTGVPTVSIGGQVAVVASATSYGGSNGGSTVGYPFGRIHEVIVTVPPGLPGPADITVLSDAGTATLPHAFTYLQVNDYPSFDAFSYVLYDSQRHWVYLAAGDHIDVFSADTNQFLSPINPPHISGTPQIRGLALTPDHSKLISANVTDHSVAIINPDSPSSSNVVQIPVTVTDSPGIADVVATSTGKVFVDGVSGTFTGCGSELWELDLTTLKTTKRTDLPFLQLAGNDFSRSATGSEVLLASYGCGAYLWNAATDKFTLGVGGLGGSTSGDGVWLASDYTRLDTNMTQQVQSKIPEFFSSSLFTSDLRGEKLNASGSLLYSPVPIGFGNVQSNGVAITDTNHGTWLGQIALSEQLQPLAQTLMDFDEANNRVFLVTNQGLTIVELPPVPVSIGYLNPASGSSSGGTAVTIRGSGFEAGTTVSFGTTSVTATYVDAGTLKVVAPGGTVGGTRITIRNPDGESYSLDAAFSYQ